MANEIEPVILAVETATRAGSVTIIRAEKILASVSGDGASSHSTDLIENIKRVLSAAAIDLAAVDVFAAAAGPGSFTGLRIGLATVKSLAVSMGRKCAGVSTLEAVAFAAGDSDRTVALLPAGRGELFAQMFAVRDRDVVALDAATHVTPQMLLARYESLDKIKWAGEGAHLQLETLRSGAEAQGITFNREPSNGSSPAWLIAPSQDKLADAVAMLALREWRNTRLIHPEDLRADYVRASDAEIKTKD